MDRKHVEDFLSHPNRLRPTIQFTMELEENGALPFLDTTITGVYRKPTHTDRYVQYTAHHPSHALFDRARAITHGATETGKRSTSPKYCKITNIHVSW